MVYLHFQRTEEVGRVVREYIVWLLRGFQVDEMGTPWTCYCLGKWSQWFISFVCVNLGLTGFICICYCGSVYLSNQPQRTHWHDTKLPSGTSTNHHHLSSESDEASTIVMGLNLHLSFPWERFFTLLNWIFIYLFPESGREEETPDNRRSSSGSRSKFPRVGTDD